MTYINDIITPKINELLQREGGIVIKTKNLKKAKLFGNNLVVGFIGRDGKGYSYLPFKLGVNGDFYITVTRGGIRTPKTTTNYFYVMGRENDGTVFNFVSPINSNLPPNPGLLIIAKTMAALCSRIDLPISTRMLTPTQYLRFFYRQANLIGKIEPTRAYDEQILRVRSLLNYHPDASKLYKTYSSYKNYKRTIDLKNLGLSPERDPGLRQEIDYVKKTIKQIVLTYWSKIAKIYGQVDDIWIRFGSKTPWHVPTWSDDWKRISKAFFISTTTQAVLLPDGSQKIKTNIFMNADYDNRASLVGTEIDDLLIKSKETLEDIRLIYETTILI